MNERPLRLFLALDLPETVAKRLAAWCAASCGEGLRCVARENLHVTLAFLGSVAVERVDEVWRAARGSRPPGPVRLEAGAVEGVPRRRPRLLALGLGNPDGEAAALAGRVGDALAGAGLYKPVERPFWPHVTMARARRGARVEVPAGPGPALDPFAATALTLYRSQTSPRGARYTALERLELPA